MEPQTTTDAPVENGGMSINGVPVDDQGMALPEPEQTETTEAVSQATETEQTTTEAPASVDNSQSADTTELASWAESKGLALNSDTEVKLAKMAREAERAMHQKAQRASELEKTMTTMSDESVEQYAESTGQDAEMLKRVQRMEVRDSIREFWDSNPDAKNYEQDMAKIAVESGLYGTPEAILKASYAIAKASNMDAVKSQGGREALEALSHKQQAAVPRGNAVNSASSSSAITPQNVDQMVANMSSEEYRKRLPEINAAMAG